MPITIRMEENLFLKQAFEKGQAEGHAEGHAEGEAEGRLREARSLLLRQLEKRFGTVPARIRTRVEKADLESLETWSLKILEAATIRDVF